MKRLFCIVLLFCLVGCQKHNGRSNVQAETLRQDILYEMVYVLTQQAQQGIARDCRDCHGESACDATTDADRRISFGHGP